MPLPRGSSMTARSRRRDDETRNSHHVFRGHGVSNHREGLLADRIIRRQIIGGVEPDPFNGIAWSEHIDIDGLRAVERDVLKLVILEEDVVVFASLIALRLVVFLDLLAGDGIHIPADDAVVGLAVERVKSDFFVFRGCRHHLHGTGDEREL